MPNAAHYAQVLRKVLDLSGSDVLIVGHASLFMSE
jgi:hypothetical protein